MYMYTASTSPILNVMATSLSRDRRQFTSFISHISYTSLSTVVRPDLTFTVAWNPSLMGSVVLPLIFMVKGEPLLFVSIIDSCNWLS